MCKYKSLYSHEVPGLSSTGDKAISWTTNINTAKFFTTRFKDNGRLLTGKVYIKDIIIMYDREPRCEKDEEGNINDSEEEVLVKPYIIMVDNVKNKRTK